MNIQMGKCKMGYNKILLDINFASPYEFEYKEREN
jgi:hypothetical protein